MIFITRKNKLLVVNIVLVILLTLLGFHLHLFVDEAPDPGHTSCPSPVIPSTSKPVTPCLSPCMPHVLVCPEGAMDRLGQGVVLGHVASATTVTFPSKSHDYHICTCRQPIFAEVNIKFNLVLIFHTRISRLVA